MTPIRAPFIPADLHGEPLASVGLVWTGEPAASLQACGGAIGAEKLARLTRVKDADDPDNIPPST